MAIPGYKLFYEGNLKFGERLTQAQFDVTVHDAVEKGAYKGVQFHDYPSADSGVGLENFVANEGIGTDSHCSLRGRFSARDFP